jgi:hypothetical protein
MTEKRLTFGILCALSLFWLCAIAPAQEGKKSLTNEDFQRIAKKYLEAWGAGPGSPFIWVIVAMPNASVPLNIPGIFGAEGLSVAGGRARCAPYDRREWQDGARKFTFVIFARARPRHLYASPPERGGGSFLINGGNFVFP